MLILGIETSCDETGIAVVEAKGGKRRPKIRILSNIVASQIKIHEKFGGVVPNLAKREHQKNLPIVLTQALKKAGLNPKKIPDINVIAVTNGPGLEPALWTGINFAKSLSSTWNKPLVSVNHLEGHIYTPLLMRRSPKIHFPAMTLLVSGGHTELVLMKDYLQYKLLGSTRDDAAGEAFDKVARMLGLSYPGGPKIEKLAQKGNGNAFDFPRPMMNQKNFDFSFSGLKTSVLYTLKDIKENKKLYPKPSALYPDIAASFQQATTDVLITKTVKAASIHKPKTIILGGGVAANSALRTAFKKELKKLKSKPYLLLPITSLAVDNGAMIAAAGYFYALEKRFANTSKLKADGNRNFPKQ